MFYWCSDKSRVQLADLLTVKVLVSCSPSSVIKYNCFLAGAGIHHCGNRIEKSHDPNEPLWVHEGGAALPSSALYTSELQVASAKQCSEQSGESNLDWLQNAALYGLQYLFMKLIRYIMFNIDVCINVHFVLSALCCVLYLCLLVQKERILQKSCSQLLHWSCVMCPSIVCVSLSLTFMKEGDVVILHRTKVHILPEVGLLWGVRCQQTLSMESLLWGSGLKAELGHLTERDLKMYAKPCLQLAVFTCSNETVKPACRVVEVICYQWIRTTEKIQQHKQVL